MLAKFCVKKQKKAVMELLHQVPLTASTTTRRLEVLAEDCFSNLLTDLEKAEVISLAIDTSCDRTDMEQSLFTRYIYIYFYYISIQHTVHPSNISTIRSIQVPNDNMI